MVAYNHERFIAQAIESVLMQKTTFPIELVIGEDCSTDGTRAIICRYAAARPDVIRLILQTTNTGAMSNSCDVVNACRGEYLAFLEGDDFWTCAQKLQKQVDFLEAHPDCPLSFHLVDAVDDVTGQKMYEYPELQVRKPFYTLVDIVRRNYIHTCSTVVRRACLPPRDATFRRLKLGDWPTFILAARHGYLAYLDEKMGCYRQHAGGYWQSKPPDEKYLCLMEVLDWLGHVLTLSERWRIRNAARALDLELVQNYQGKHASTRSRKIAWRCLLRFRPTKPRSSLLFLRTALRLMRESVKTS
jgi:glycosyltransferase involved in cell wall biosynthesis